MREDISVHRGSVKNFEYTLKDEAGDAINITGATITMTVKEKLRDPDASAIFSRAGTIITATSGRFDVKLLVADTDTRNPGKYYYDVTVSISSTEIYTVAHGIFEILTAVNL